MNMLDAVLVNLRITSFDTNCRDSRVSEEVAEERAVEEKRMCRVYKSLFIKNAYTDEVNTMLNAIRTYHYTQTHSWQIEGLRMLATANLPEYIKVVRDMEASLREKVETLVSHLDTIKQASKVKLGELYNEADYPTQEELRNAYAIKLSVQPMPVASEMTLIGLSQEDIARLGNQYKKDAIESYRKAHDQMWGDARKRVKNIVSMLKSNKKTISNRTLTSTVEALDTAVRAAIVKDENFSLVVDSVKAALAEMDAKEAKVNDKYREELIVELGSIVDYIADLEKSTIAEYNEQMELASAA